MSEILKKYEKYGLTYYAGFKVLHIRNSILVSDFIQLRKDIERAGIELKNIIVEGR